MKTLQKGFTLIELMIVVAIIGILAAIAVPAYQDYTIKSKVSETASLMAPVKTAIDIAFSEGTQINNLGSLSVDQLGVGSAAQYSGKYVSFVTFGPTAGGSAPYIIACLRTEGATGRNLALGTADSTCVQWDASSSGANLRWDVASSLSVTPAGQTGITPAKYRPKN